MDQTERRYLSSYWGVLTLRGVLAILFGIAAVFWPGITLVTLVYLFSAYVLVRGLVSIVQGVSGIGARGGWFLTLIVGLLEVGVGVYLLRHPTVAFATFILLIGFTLIVEGVIDGVMALGEEASATQRTLTMIVALLSILAGIVILFQPAASGVAFVWILGVYALISGPLLIAMSMDTRDMLTNGGRTVAASRPGNRRR